LLIFRCLFPVLLWLAAGRVSAQVPAPAPSGSGLSIVEAVRITLSENPILHLQERQVDISRGARILERGIFDTVLGSSVKQSRVYTPLTKSAQLSAKQSNIFTSAQSANLTTTTLDLQKLLPWGISIGPVLNLDRNNDNLTNQTGLNNSLASFQVTIPLLRNRGRAVVTARERFAEFELQASFYDLSQTASQLIAGTAGAYWNQIGAVETLELYRQSEDRGRVLLENVQTLINADQLPRSEINNVVANLADRTTSRIAAEQRLVQATQSLALAMGVGPSQILSLPEPTDPLPDGLSQPDTLMTNLELDEYIHEAFTRRADYLASKKRIQSSNALLVAARNQLKPQVDAVFSAGYAGLQETNRFDKYLSSAFQNVSGPTVIGTLRYSFPFGNHLAEGQLVQSVAGFQQSQLRSTDLERNIASNVVVAATGLRFSVEQLRKAREASDAFRAALQAQRDKLRLGVGSLIDILQEEDRYIGASLNEINARVGYAVNIANFRLATGTFLLPDQPVQPVSRDLFYVPGIH